jgi:hypothetical protein
VATRWRRYVILAVAHEHRPMDDYRQSRLSAYHSFQRSKSSVLAHQPGHDAGLFSCFYLELAPDYVHDRKLAMKSLVHLTHYKVPSRPCRIVTRHQLPLHMRIVASCRSL